MSQKFQYQCITCGASCRKDEVVYLCPDCSKYNTENLPPKGVLKVVYSYKQPEAPDSCSLTAPMMKFEELKINDFIDLLPLNSIDSLPKLQIGNTPLYYITKLNDDELSFELFLKDDSQNPTYSFKDRASAMVSAYAKENNFKTIVAASTGNAGSSIAGICAAQKQQAIVIVPEKAPLAKLTQILMYGAKLIPVKGSYDDAFDLSIKASNEFGWYNRNTAYNPITIEGKKTVVFELFEQLDYCVPDRIFVPVGDGVIISGVYKGYEDLLKLGIISRVPIIVAVQSKGSDNLVRNIVNETFEIKKSNTIADSIAVDIPRNYYMAKHYIEKYNGELLSVKDDDILAASCLLSQNTGLFAEPAAATSFAGLLNYRKHQKIQNGSKNVVLLTGSGLKDLNAVQNIIKMPEAIKPDLKYLNAIRVVFKKIT